MRRLLKKHGTTQASPGLRIDGTAGSLEATAANHPHIVPTTIRGTQGPGPLAPPYGSPLSRG